MTGISHMFAFPPPPPRTSVDGPQRWPELPFFGMLGPTTDWDILAATLPDFVRKVYRHACMFIGEEEAKVLFLQTVSKGKGKRGRGKNLVPNRNEFLLHKYDLFRREILRRGMAPTAVRRVPRILAGMLHEHQPGRYGASPKAIERQIRRVLGERAKRRSAMERIGLPSTVLAAYADY